MPNARRPLLACLAVAGAIYLPVCLGQTGENDLTARLDQAASTFQKNRNFIGTVLVAKGGNILFEKGYGMADIEWSIPNSPAAKFRLGSITKQFTATAILQLAEQHKLSLQDPACKYFDACPDAWKKITIHQLLSHTSGIPSYTDDKDFSKPPFLRVPKTPGEVLLLSKDKPLEFEPGTKWKYDNSGYTFLGVILEKASGEKYADYLNTHIFQPLSMSDSGYDQTAVVLPHRASGYQPCGKSLCNSDYIDMSLPYSAGSLYSTVDDLYKWDRALNTDKLLTKASRDLMFTPVIHDYGYGWMLGRMANHKQIGHGGGIPGFSTYIARFPEDDATVIVLSNNAAGDPGGVAAALAGTLFGEKVNLPGEMKAVPISSAVIDRYVGTYQVGPLLMTFTNENGHLMVAPKGQPKIEALASSETQFFVDRVGAVFTFIPGADGKASEVKLEQSGATLSGKRTN
jgi:D-alanyl-D-alanine carboxypeptidase